MESLGGYPNNDGCPLIPKENVKRRCWGMLGSTWGQSRVKVLRQGKLRPLATASPSAGGNCKLNCMVYQMRLWEWWAGPDPQMVGLRVDKLKPGMDNYF